MPLSRYTDNQQALLFWAPKLPALMSILCSFTVVGHLCLRRHGQNNILQKVFGRLWLAVTIGNILICCMALLSSLPAPKYTMYGAMGTEGTCQAAGALFHFVFVNCMGYNASLGVYYYISVHTKWNDAYLRRYVEPIFHVTSFVYPLIGVAFGLGYKMYAAHDIFMYCWAAPAPFGCRNTDESVAVEYGGPGDCTSGNRFRALFVFLCGLIECNALTGMKLMGVFAIYFTVLKQQRIMKTKYHTRSTTSTVTSEICIQAVLFLLACIIPYGGTILMRLLDLFWVKAPFDGAPGFFAFSFMVHTLFPLQGVLNLICYFRPKLMQRRRDFPNETRYELWYGVWYMCRKTVSGTLSSNTVRSTMKQGASMQVEADRTTTTQQELNVISSSSAAATGNQHYHQDQSNSKTTEDHGDLDENIKEVDPQAELPTEEWENDCSSNKEGDYDDDEEDVLGELDMVDVKEFTWQTGCVPGEDLGGDIRQSLAIRQALDERHQQKQHRVPTLLEP